MKYMRAGRGLVIVAAAAVMVAPLGLAGRLAATAGEQPPSLEAAASTFSSQVWEIASRGDAEAMLGLFDDPGAAKHAESVALLKTNMEARETKRSEEIAKVRERLERVLAEESELALGEALRAAIELSMLSTDKRAILEEEKIVALIQRAELEAMRARAESNWLVASELYYRLNLLFEDRNAEYKENTKRENQRLAMIRLYAPERLWELRNNRRNAELDRQDRLRAQGIVDDEDTEDGAEVVRTPLPPYNAMGDDYREKLAGIEANMVRSAITRAAERHVEQRAMNEILIGAINAVRTLITTPDLEPIFPGIADPEALEQFLAFLDDEERRLQRIGAQAGPADLFALLERMITRNERTVHLAQGALLHEFGNGAMDALDEFSAIVWPDEIRRFNRNTQGRFIGVGIQIEQDELFNIRVVTPLEGTPAQRAGVRPGDLIKKVNGTSTIGFTLDQAVDVITGPENTQVVLTLERTEDEQPRELDLTLRRAVIPIYTVRGWKRHGPREDQWEWFIDRENKIGYIRLSGFNERTDIEFDRGIEQMRKHGLNGLILDLRHNPGGLLEQSVGITSRFVDRDRTRNHNAMVVTTHDKDNRLMQREQVQRGKASLTETPVVVLINEGSASASEIVSGALQDYARVGDVRALVLGTRSYGKGSVQNVWPFQRPVPAAVKVTTQYYHLPGGRTIHKVPGADTWGVEPDMTVEMLPGQIAEAFRLRQAADVMRLNENGEVDDDDGDRPDPEDLINKGIDLQLHKALVILQSQTASRGGPTLVDKP